MSKITKLSSQKRGEFVNLYVDDEFFCGLSLNQIAARRLHQGQEISEAELEEIKHEAYESKAYNAAIGYVALRIRSEKEVVDYLRRKGYEHAVAGTIARLKSEHYLDDIDFTRRWIKMRQDQNWAPRAIQVDLLKKGIHIDVADVSDKTAIQAAIVSLIQKKTRYQSFEREKLMMYLAGKGFSYADIKSALDSLDV